MSNSDKKCLPEERRLHKRISVYDFRRGSSQGKHMVIDSRSLDYKHFLQALRKKFEFEITSPGSSWVLTDTDRNGLNSYKFDELRDGSTLLLLDHTKQELLLPTEERINFQPHYDTVTKSGVYEYYDSEGQKSLPYALAELLDNSISATAKNTSVRMIEIRMLFDETHGKPAVVVVDNGCGMTAKQLNNWAVFRLSKFSKPEGYVPPEPTAFSLNSDISYFGVGGKQAVFFIGDSVRMITKAAGSPDVHELVLSEEQFVQKEKNQEDIYTEVIRNRKPCDSSHICRSEERFLHAVIAEESEKESFTAVVITGVRLQHITALKDDFEGWTRQLAHTYHYYIHGDIANEMKRSDHRPEIDIQISLREKLTKCPRVMNLREVNNDMQALYINNAADKFTFQAEVSGAVVEGIIRYHPFLYDRETYPEDPHFPQAPFDEEDDNESGILTQARGNRPIFECFWNGRLIPYTTISEFEWCAFVKGSKVPADCYSRFSGVLFTNDKFQVTMNKLTFIDLEVKLKSKDTIFTCTVNGQTRRRNIQKEFTQWLLYCHEKFDKQVKFLNYTSIITRTDVAVKKLQHPWATFTAIQWGNRTFNKGQLVKTQRTLPIMHGTIVHFLLYGTYVSDVFATGGHVEIQLEPRALYDQTKIIPISKIDRTATEDAIQININNDLAKVPDKLIVKWPECKPWEPNSMFPAGTQLGPLNVEIVNQKEECLSRIPSMRQRSVKKLSVMLRLIFHDPKGDEEIASSVCQYSQQWNFWFKEIKNLVQLGQYTLCLNTILSENNSSTFGGQMLPSFTLKFGIKEGEPESFSVVDIGDSTVLVGEAFDIPLQLKDAYHNPTPPLPNLEPFLECRDLNLSYDFLDCSGSTFIIKGVKAFGKIQNPHQYKAFELKVTLPGLKEDTQTFKFNLLPGKPHFLRVMPDDDVVAIENGNPIKFSVEVCDVTGNVTAHPNQVVHCQVKSLPTAMTDCSSTGAGLIVTETVKLKLTRGQSQNLNVTFQIPGHKDILEVVKEIVVIPSTRLTQIEVGSQNNGNLIFRDNDKLEWPAGGLLDNLYYKLYDEGGRQVFPTAEIASSIKVNWTGDVCLEDLAQGKLPAIEVPTMVQEGRFYQVSLQDQSMSVSFTIDACPGEPVQLKVTLPESTVRLGETLPGNIKLGLLDKYGNMTKALSATSVNDITVEGEGLVKSALEYTWKKSSHSVFITGVRFQSGSPGSRELCFTYKTFVERVIIKVATGHPAQLVLLSGPKQPLQVLNEHGINTEFVLQVCDKWGNCSNDQRVVVHIRPSSDLLKVTNSVTSQPVDLNGQASFVVNRVSGPKGNYRLLFRGFFSLSPIPGPSVDLTVIPDGSRPVGLSVQYDKNVKCPAGGVFPVFTVTVVSEEGNPITTCNPAAITMLLWSGESSGSEPPATAEQLTCSKPPANQKKDCFHFRNKRIPPQVGQYSIQFSLCTSQTTKLFSNQILVEVVANQPAKLGPDIQPPTPLVFHSRDIANRTLVENMTLRILDSYGNPAGENMQGIVSVIIKNYEDNSNKVIPQLEGESSCNIRLSEGKAHINTLAIMENSPGEDGASYILLFKPEVLMDPTPLAPFQLRFHFYNDSEHQTKMSELSRKKDELSTAIETYRGLLATYTELVKCLTVQYQDAKDKEAILRNHLISKDINLSQTVTITAVDQLLSRRACEADQIKKMPRRVCSIAQPLEGQQDVLGKVGHLAFVQDDDDARVISWHIRGDMDCVVAKTTAAAKRIYDTTRGMQQVLPLDSIYVATGHRSLPHIRNGQPLFQPPGNPVFARDLLIYPQNNINYSMVFRNLLGDTIVMDDLDSATNYRRILVQNKIPCPTILTRQGERVSTKGKFGGEQNKAPPISNLQVFGAPLPQRFHTLKEQIELLTKYRSVLQNKLEAQEERDEQMKQSDVMQNKQREMDEKVIELLEVEKQLASTSQQPKKRSLQDAGRTPGTHKRQKNV
ncbi:structural maintenance of chromosomes flexible hinge domain-containing protein 1 [Dunckerocampus dactyliophorus]|uniref:structural maintenance of chromosomes flexible hinge domain-containing protein 1 n=1 Tax=Dunckerocampus dactyliophorus TaxID=161453 RepID=UPI0024070205|nr:structural maintenance of chromosomes flexible hinge domain-containing protein 1 [Dunckerocampus dactyliophorus]